mgnify:CR=1 FL=1
MGTQMTRDSFSFATATEIRFGRGTAAGISDAVARIGRRILLVTGSRPERVAWLSDGLAAQDCAVTAFGVAGEPDLAAIEAGIATAREAGADTVVAIGGGSVIDTGKAIAALVPATRPVLDHLEVVGRGLPLEAAPLPMIAVPTTAGTGAEVTRNAVIAVPAQRRKVSLRSLAMLPRLAVVDPSLVESCPRPVLIASGLDAVTQVIEPYISSRATPLTDAICRDAIPAGLGALVTLADRPDPAAFDAMALTSLSGGMALANAGLGVVHGLAGPLGGLSGAAHGAICGTLLPHGLAANARHGRDPALARRIDEVRGWIGGALGCAPGAAFDTLAAWVRANGLGGLDKMGIGAEQRAAAAEAAASSSSMKANPVALDAADLAALMEAAR